MARSTKVVSFSALPDEVAAWMALAGGNLSAWIRATCNAAVSPTVVEVAPDLSRMIADAVSAALESKGIGTTSAELTRDPGAYVPTPIPPLPAGTRNVPLGDDEEDRLRHRGMVAAFLRVRGERWPPPAYIGQIGGPSPLQRGCQVRADVLEEFGPKLDALALDLQAEQAQFGGVQPPASMM